MTPESYNNLPFSFYQPQQHIDNETFLRSVYPEIPKDEFQWVTFFEGDPGNRDAPINWGGMSVLRRQDGSLSVRSDYNLNSYFSVSSFRYNAGGRIRRTDDCFAHRFAISIDDVGSGPSAKIPWKILKDAGMPMASYVIETSPDNCQVGYIITPYDDATWLGVFMRALVFGVLQQEQDPGMLNNTRYQRLPVGCNSKQKYVDSGGAPFKNILHHWRPDLRYEPLALAQAMGLDLEDWDRRVNAGLQRDFAASDCKPDQDHVYQGLVESGLVRTKPSRRNNGAMGVDITCPWVDTHTGGEDSGSCYFIGGEGVGGYTCHHGHCIDRDYRSVVNWLKRQAPPAVREKVYNEEMSIAFGPAPLLETVKTSSGSDAMKVGDRVLVGEPLVAAAEPESTREFLIKKAYELPEKVVLDMGKNAAQVSRFCSDLAVSGIRGADRMAILQLVEDRTGLKKSSELKELMREADKASSGERNERLATKEKVFRGQRDQDGRLHRPILSKEEWVDFNRDGLPDLSLANVTRLVRATGGVIHMNDMTKVMEFAGAFAGMDKSQLIQWIADAAARNKMNRPSAQVVRLLLDALGAENRFHPFGAYLDGVAGTWDLQDRLRGPDGLFNDFTLEDENHVSLELRDVVLQRWLYSIVAAAKWLYKGRFGCHPRGVLVINGEQYSGKTTWLGNLLPTHVPGLERCFMAGAHYDGSKDSILAILSAMVCELGEIDSTMNKAETGRLKAFLSMDSDTIRRPYGETYDNFPRRTILAGTVNRDDFLRDRTGSSRFWVIQTKKIRRRPADSAIVDQVWAQITAECMTHWNLYLQGMSFEENAPWLMEPDEMRALQSQNKRHEVQTQTEQALLDLFDWRDATWIASPNISDRLKINPMTQEQIRQYLGGQLGMGPADFRRVLAQLTGQKKSKQFMPLGKPFGRYWSMPPKIVNVLIGGPEPEMPAKPRGIH